MVGEGYNPYYYASDTPDFALAWATDNLTSDRVYWHMVNKDTLCFQMAENNTEGLADNSALIIQDLSGAHTTQIEDNSRLTIGVKDAYIVNSNNLEGKTTFLGDGTQWNLLKNPTGETATVTFSVNGGSSIDPVQVALGQKLVSVPTPTKTDYVFDDWYLNGEPFDFDTPITDDITLTAKWLSYEVVDYIESTGTEYIDTGVKASTNTKTSVEYQLTSIINQGRIFGYTISTSDSADACYEMYVNGSSDLGYSYNDSVGNWISTGTAADTQKHSIIFNQGQKLILDGTEIAMSGSITKTSKQTLCIFNSYRNGVSQVDSATYSSMRLYSFKIYDNDVLVRNFVPIKTATGVYALLDQVENKVYYNAGTGAFIGGEAV